MKKKIMILFLCLSFCVPACAVHISGLGALISIISRLYGVNLKSLTVLRNLKSTNKLLTQLDQQVLQQEQQQVGAMTGHYGIGDLYNSQHDQALQLWSADTWQDLLQQASGGNQQRLKELMQEFDQKYPHVKAEQIVPGQPAHPKATLYQTNQQTNRAVQASATYTYEDINRQIRTLQQLLGKIEQTNNQKSALDLNARLIAQLGFIQLQTLRLQSMQTQLMSLQMQAQTNGVTTDTRFLQG